MICDLYIFVGLQILLLANIYCLSSEVNILRLTSKQAKQSVVSINPSSLEIYWELIDRRKLFGINQAGLKINKLPQRATNLQYQATNKVTWRLQPSQMSVTATLDKYLKLNFISPRNIQRISIDKPFELMWFNLVQNGTEALFIPFSEGMRIPINDSQWIHYLSKEYTGSNTCNDLKMPFWSLAQQHAFINYQLITATNNQLNFSSAKGKLDMRATHFFTTLNYEQPFVICISLGFNILSGAKMYRDWHFKNYPVKTLEQKRDQNPEVDKLIGASHAYLFGHDELAASDVKDWWGLKKWYFNQTELVPTNDALKKLKPLEEDEDRLRVEDKTRLLHSIYSSLKVRFPTASPTPSNNQIKAQFYAAQNRKKVLINSAGAYLIHHKKWGQGISKDMIQNLREAGIDKIWLGFDNWMPAFFQPEVIEQAKKAGFLVATYDSYNTAIAPGVNDAWLTAQLPGVMHNNCAIINSNGDKQQGFHDSGFYLNPACQQHYVKQRIKDILKFGRFNSLFLDVDGTGMAREDYRESQLFPEGMNANQMLDAFNARLKWAGNKTLLGTEDGNSLTTEGIAFAHGMETVGFGWTDPDMHDNNRSSYFLGAWYPENKPAFFFAKTNVKSIYKRLFFSPQFRVPLYQSVFHDVVINSHHWHTDSKKFSNVQVYRDLISMLYNTPAMVHLVRDEADAVDAPRLQALKHYQDGFQPIHRVIWNKSLIDFSWLDFSGQVQQTVFSDGSKIIANFGQQPYRTGGHIIKPASILAKLSNGEIVTWQSTVENNKSQTTEKKNPSS